MRTLIVIGILTFSFPCVAEKYVEVDLKNFKFIAYENGKVVRSGPATGGRNFCSDIGRRCKTKPGEYKALTRKGRYYRSDRFPLGCDNSSKDIKKKCSPMPFSIKLTYDGMSLHGANDNWNGKIYHRSHSCVHMKNSDIEFLNKEFVEVGKTRIIILPY